MSIDQHYADFLRGIEEFNREAFFECHDTWEEIWQETAGADKLFLQGIIHAAVGLYHFTNGRWKGARSQLEKCVSKLAPYRPTYRGIAVETLIQTFEEKFLPAIARAASGEKISPPPFPKLAAQPKPNEENLSAKLDQQRVLFQNEIETLKAELRESKTKLAAEQEKFSLMLKRQLKSARRKELALLLIIAALLIALVASLALR